MLNSSSDNKEKAQSHFVRCNNCSDCERRTKVRRFCRAHYLFDSILSFCAGNSSQDPHKKIKLCLPCVQCLISSYHSTGWLNESCCTYRIKRSSSLDTQSPFSSWEYSNICLHTQTHTLFLAVPLKTIGECTIFDLYIFCMRFSWETVTIKFWLQRKYVLRN